jgi:6-phosphogluconolactonase
MIEIRDDLEALSRAAAELFARQAQEAAAQRGRFSVALSGGNTPKRTYELLAQPPLRDQVPWPQVHVFWGDERCVPPADPRSNYRMARQALLDHVPIPAAQVHRVAGEKPPQQAAADYQLDVQQFFQGAPPRFDLVYLGLGDNGHTASLFPNTPVLQERQRWVAEVYVAEQSMYRVTMTALLLNQAALVAFIVSGAGKAGVLPEVIEGPPDTQRLPAQLIQPAPGQLLWLVDRAAAAKLTKT